jgi:hypothetical protein
MNATLLLRVDWDLNLLRARTMVKLAHKEYAESEEHENEKRQEKKVAA